MAPIIVMLGLLGLAIFLIWRSANNTGQLDRILLEELNGNRSLARQLQDAVRGDKKLARRLLNSAKFKYPGKSDRWYVEKIIYDLERDGAGSRSTSSSYQVDKRELRENLFLAGTFLWVLSSLTSLIDRFLR